MRIFFFFILFSVLLIAIGCSVRPAAITSTPAPAAIEGPTHHPELLSDKGYYLRVPLKTDLTSLTDEEKKVLRILIDAASLADPIFMKQSGGEDYYLQAEAQGKEERWRNNYGPWDRLQNNQPFLSGVGPKPEGAGFYPSDMTVKEFEHWNNPVGKSPYTMVRRNAQGNLEAVWYHQAFKKEVDALSQLLEEASNMTSDAAFSLYLRERARAVQTDRYGASDVAWLKMKDNRLDLIVGPIENYEDKLLGLKTSYEAYVLVKDVEWSKRLERYAGILPKLQTILPGPEQIHHQQVGSHSQLAAYDVVYYAGECNSGSKTIAVNLPNDEEIQQEWGTRRSQLRNAMKAKYEHILHPIASRFISDEQLKHITFDAFFANVMFHEVAHGLGAKHTMMGGQTLHQNQTVREALREHHNWLEEEKADVLGLWLIGKLVEMGEWKADMADHYTTFVAGIFRSCRFGTASAHGVANVHAFNFLIDKEAIVKREDGLYFVVFEKMKKAIEELAAQILQLQYEGNYEGAALAKRAAILNPEIVRSLNALTVQGVPVDLVFDQGYQVLMGTN